jgi:hypothetical protein
MICQRTLADVSEGGGKLLLEDASNLPDSFVLVLSFGARTHRKCSVRWRTQTAVGVQFILG